MTALADFPTPNALGDGRFWSAVFASLDARNDEAYWWVTVTKPDGTSSAFFAQVDVFDSVEGDAARASFQRQIAAVAATGKANTDYRGSTMWQLRRKKLGL